MISHCQGEKRHGGFGGRRTGCLLTGFDVRGISHSQVDRGLSSIREWSFQAVDTQPSPPPQHIPTCADVSLSSLVTVP